ncbi:MAG: hypothetical protein IPO92_13885 [Saprospiraceae bacterium]|nr:hypothetical protein [Saprospiraceae bacterium]
MSIQIVSCKRAEPLNHKNIKTIEQTTELYSHFEKYIKLSDTLKSELTKRISFKTFKKGELIHNADKICITSYFIHKGLMRTYFIKDGKEITEYFSAENEWVNSPKSFMQQQLDIYYIDTIEQTDCFCLNVKDLVFLLTTSLKWNAMPDFRWELYLDIIWTV